MSAIERSLYEMRGKPRHYRNCHDPKRCSGAPKCISVDTIGKRRQIMAGRGNLRLRPDQVAFIRAVPLFTSAEWAEILDVTGPCIDAIRTGRSWSWFRGSPDSRWLERQMADVRSRILGDRFRDVPTEKPEYQS